MQNSTFTGGVSGLYILPWFYGSVLQYARFERNRFEHMTGPALRFNLHSVTFAPLHRLSRPSFTAYRHHACFLHLASRSDQQTLSYLIQDNQFVSCNPGTDALISAGMLTGDAVPLRFEGNTVAHNRAVVLVSLQLVYVGASEHVVTHNTFENNTVMATTPDALAVPAVIALRV